MTTLFEFDLVDTVGFDGDAVVGVDRFDGINAEYPFNDGNAVDIASDVDGTLRADVLTVAIIGCFCGDWSAVNVATTRCRDTVGFVFVFDCDTVDFVGVNNVDTDRHDIGAFAVVRAPDRGRPRITLLLVTGRDPEGTDTVDLGVRSGSTLRSGTAIFVVDGSGCCG